MVSYHFKTNPAPVQPVAVSVTEPPSTMLAPVATGAAGVKTVTVVVAVLEQVVVELLAVTV